MFPSANFCSRPDLEDFLRNPSATKTTLNRFSSISSAREFARKYTGTFSNYSTKMEAGGKSDKSFVTVHKTDSWVKLANQEYEQAVNEKQVLVSRFSIDDQPVCIPCKRSASPDVLILLNIFLAELCFKFLVKFRRSTKNSL